MHFLEDVVLTLIFSEVIVNYARDYATLLAYLSVKHLL